jgi:hypothetical protein
MLHSHCLIVSPPQSNVLQARGQVLLEVNRDYSHPERLLGEHRWREFLVNLTEEEAGRSSMVFYSTYSAGRQAQKDGWHFPAFSPSSPIVACFFRLETY